MPFDPTLPQENTEIDAVQMRAQLNALKADIDAGPAGSPGADGAPGAPGTPGAPGPGLNLRGDWNGGDFYDPGDVIFHDGQAFVAIGSSHATTPEGDLAHWRTLTIVGPQGEVSSSQLTNAITAAIAGTPHNPSLTPLSLTVSDPPTQAEMQALVDFVNALLNQITRT